MIKLIASQGCSNCRVAAARLRKEDIDFKYQLMTSLPAEDRTELRDRAKAAVHKSFPIILNENEEVIKLEEVIKQKEDN